MTLLPEFLLGVILLLVAAGQAIIVLSVRNARNFLNHKIRVWVNISLIAEAVVGVLAAIFCTLFGGPYGWQLFFALLALSTLLALATQVSALLDEQP